MAYSGPPGVLVNQVFASASAVAAAPSLPACVVGPAYQVEHKSLAGTYAGSADTYLYPSLKSGAVITTAKVKAYIQQADLTETDITTSATIDATDVDLPIDLEEAIQGSSTTGQKTDKSFADVNAEFITNGVRAGDFIAVTTSRYEIADIVSETEVTLLVTPTETNDITYTVERTLTGNVLVTYVALRTDAAVVDQFLEFSTQDDMVTTFGEDALDDPESVLPFGLARAFRNAGRTVYAYVIDGEAAEATGHGAAMDVLSTKRLYHVAPLTYSTSVLASWISHANTRSVAETKAWRRVYLSQVIAETLAVDTGADGATDAPGTGFSSATSTFQSDGVKAGDILTLTDQVDDPTYVIQTVDSETAVTLETAATGDLTDEAFLIDRPYTRTQMAENLRAVGLATANQRVTRTAPDKYFVTVSGAEVEVAGYYAAAARAGYASSVPIGRPQVYGTIGGFDRIEHSNDFFTEDQLNVIAEGGIEILTQSTISSPIQIRDDLTTDMSAYNKQNISMVISRDWLSYTVADILSPQVGRYNITERYLNILRGSVRAVFDLALSLPDEAFTGLVLNSLVKNESQSGRVSIEIAVAQGEPGKYIDVDLVI